MSHANTTILQDSTAVLQDLYDGLQVKAILQHEETKSSKNCSEKFPSTYNKRRRSRWQHWLDDLCLLCDSHRGGVTTTSVAVEQTTDGVAFWLAMNSGDLDETSVHLAALLGLVKRSREGDDENLDRNTAICEIYTRAIERSPQRVKNYAKRLENVLQLVCTGADADGDWSDIVEAAWRVLEPRDDHFSMCIEAFSLSKALARRQSANPEELDQGHSNLYKVRHYLGRLSAWLGAARNVVILGAQLSEIMETYCVKVVQPTTPGAPVSLNLGEDFNVILNRVMPNFRDYSMVPGTSATVRRLSGTNAFFKSDKFELKPHAEAIMLDYFFTNNMEFANGDRYVACSRPSCYCCKLYFDHHPAGGSMGRSHGMLWIQWRLPRLLDSVEGTIDHTTLKVLRKMSDQVREDVLVALTPQKHYDFNMFNSTTGFSASHMGS